MSLWSSNLLRFRSLMSQVRTSSRWNLFLGAFLFAFWAMAALWWGADLDLLLPLATLLCGAGGVVTMLRERRLGRVSSAYMWAGCSAGVLFILWGVLHFAAASPSVRTLGSGLLILLLLGVITYMRRLGSSSGQVGQEGARR